MPNRTKTKTFMIMVGGAYHLITMDNIDYDPATMFRFQYGNDDMVLTIDDLATFARVGRRFKNPLTNERWSDDDVERMLEFYRRARRRRDPEVAVLQRLIEMVPRVAAEDDDDQFEDEDDERVDEEDDDDQFEDEDDERVDEEDEDTPDEIEERVEGNEVVESDSEDEDSQLDESDETEDPDPDDISLSESLVDIVYRDEEGVEDNNQDNIEEVETIPVDENDEDLVWSEIDPMELDEALFAEAMHQDDDWAARMNRELIAQHGDIPAYALWV